MSLLYNSLHKKSVTFLENIFKQKFSKNVTDFLYKAFYNIYTSGSTGSGKGVILSNYNMISDMIAYARLIEYSNISILCLPLYHAFGLVIVLCASLYYGQTLYVSSGILNLPEELKKFNPYNLCLVPMQIEFLYKEIIKKFQENKVFYPYKNKFLLQKILSFVYFKLSKEKITKIVESVLGKNIQFIVSGGAPMPVHTIKYFQNFGIQVINGYGTSECSPGVSVNRVGNNIMESAGQIFPCNDIIIDNECDTNEIEGEILIKGSNVMKGYYNDPDSTERAFFNGYYRTGDIGKIKNNYLYITGRCKNMILLKNGLNIFPEEIETLIHKLEYVESVMVYAENDLIVAEVYINNSGKRNLIYNDIDKINKSLPYYKRIKKIIIRDNDFQITGSGKIKRNINKEDFHFGQAQ